MVMINKDDAIKAIQNLRLKTAQQAIRVLDVIDKLPQYEVDAKDTNVLGKWIPCSERLPELDTPVLTQWRRYYSDENNIDILYLNGLGEWYADLGVPNGKVIAWMPLPEPYREEE